MKTRNSSATPKKKTPPSKKSAAKPQSTPSSVDTAPVQSPTTTTTTTTMETPPPRPGPNTRGKPAKAAEITGTPVPDITPPPEPAPAPTPATPTAPTPPTPAAPADPKAVDESVATQVTPETKPVKTRRVVRRVIRKTVIRSAKNPKSVVSTKVEESTKGNDVAEVADQKPLVKDAETAKKDNEINAPEIENITINEEPKIENVEEDKEVNLNAQESAKEEEAEAKAEESLMENVTKSTKEQELEAPESKSLEDQELTIGKEKEELMEQQEEQWKTTEDKMETMSYEGKMEDYPKEEKTDFDGLLEEADDEKIEGISEQDIHDELDQDQFPEDDVPEQGVSALEDEHAELDAAAKERKLRKELEIFVGGLDRDVTEEDLKRVFQNAGEVVDVRLHKDPSTNKNKGYAFVRFANKEQVNRALSEMKNPVIRGKRCGIAPSEDNDSLFVGNICNTWTTEAIKQKLKDFGIEGVEKITLVADPKHEGLSRGFAFLEFSCHGEAMLAYKRLQKPDAIFGHPERSVKVAFAEPLREPDPEVMAQVKSVFVDGLPPHWDEHRVKEKFRHFGEIANVVLARNMSTAKRKDFGFVDFTTHEAAVACIESVNRIELVDGNSKVKVRARLSNPLPKTQAVKGGMAGGFRIGRGGGGTHPRFGKGFGRGGRGHTFNHSNFQQDRGFYPHGPGQSSRMGFANAHELDSAYGFHGIHNSDQGGRWGLRGAHQGSTGPLPNRPNFDRVRHGGTGDYDPLRREPFPPEVNRPYLGGHIDDRYFYDDAARGMKRPYSMRDQDIGYMEPSTRRTRFEYSNASASFHGNHYRDAFVADAGRYQQDYYSSNHDGRAYPPFHGGDRPYGRGYYY